MSTPRSLRPLVLVTLVNYASLVPYYIHNDASTAHPLPGLRALVLVGVTLAWFLVGMRGVVRGRRLGRLVLFGFLAAESALYIKTFATGAVVHQMQNPSDLVRTVFVIGYVSGAVALVYLVALGRGGWSGGSRAGGQDDGGSTDERGGRGGGWRLVVYDRLVDPATR